MSDSAIASRLKIFPRYRHKFFEQLDSFGMEQVNQVLTMILQLELKLKTSSVTDPVDALELAVIKITAC